MACGATVTQLGCVGVLWQPLAFLHDGRYAEPVVNASVYK
jgi:hypothetical protein